MINVVIVSDRQRQLFQASFILSPNRSNSGIKDSLAKESTGNQQHHTNNPKHSSSSSHTGSLSNAGFLSNNRRFYPPTLIK